MFQKRNITARQIVEHIRSLPDREAEKIVSAINGAFLETRPGTVFQSSLDEEKAIFQITKRHLDKSEFALSTSVPFALMLCEYSRELLQSIDLFEQTEKVVHGINCLEAAEGALKSMVEAPEEDWC